MRVPAVVRWMGHVPAHGDTHDIVHNCDVFPTLLAAAGVKGDPKLKIDGTNLLDVWLGNAGSPERTRCFGNGVRMATCSSRRCMAI